MKTLYFFPGYNYPAATNNSQGKHGGEDVVILANGPMAHLFSVKNLDNPGHMSSSIARPIY